MSRSVGRRLAALGLATTLLTAPLLGCVEAESKPTVVVVAPTLSPPPPSSSRLTREEALKIAHESEDAADAIEILDSRAFDFELTESAIQWFGEQGVAPAIMDYLQKRSRIDWESLRGDIDPQTPR